MEVEGYAVMSVYADVFHIGSGCGHLVHEVICKMNLDNGIVNALKEQHRGCLVAEITDGPPFRVL